MTNITNGIILGGKMKKDLHLILTEDEHRELKTYAAQQGLSMKNLILESVREQCSQEQYEEDRDGREGT